MLLIIENYIMYYTFLKNILNAGAMQNKREDGKIYFCILIFASIEIKDGIVPPISASITTIILLVIFSYW